MPYSSFLAVAAPEAHLASARPRKALAIRSDPFDLQLNPQEALTARPMVCPRVCLMEEAPNPWDVCPRTAKGAVQVVAQGMLD